jgi:hypothetical protein
MLHQYNRLLQHAHEEPEKTELINKLTQWKCLFLVYFTMLSQLCKLNIIERRGIQGMSRENHERNIVAYIKVHNHSKIITCLFEIEI